MDTPLSTNLSPSGVTVEVSGADFDSRWFRSYFPPVSEGGNDMVQRTVQRAVPSGATEVVSYSKFRETFTLTCLR